ncbi:hypothetical protein D3C72_2100070 [compost metagenome]
MAGTRGADSIDRDVRISIRTVFKAYRARKGRGHLAMDLAFGGPRANRAPTNQVRDKLSDHHIEKLGGCRHAEFVHLEQ